MLTFADLIPVQGASRPGSLAMIVFLHSSIFCANFGSTWRSFRSIRNRSIHIRLGLIRFLPSHIHCCYFLSYVNLIFNHHMDIPGNAAHCFIGLIIRTAGRLSALAHPTHMLHCPPCPTSSWMLCTDRPQVAVCLESSSVFDSDLLT